MKIIKILCLVIPTIVAGCAVSPSVNDINKANYGVLPDNYQDIVKSEMGRRLKDPYTAQYDFSKPYKAWCQSGFNTYYGWLVPFSLNAKNSYGGYTGASTVVYLINNNTVRDFTSPYQVGGCGRA